MKLSIVTICFNNVEELRETMSSVDMQTEKPFEHIIIDGSTDKRIRYYLSTNQQPEYRKAIHERDKGISDAFNKGIRKSNGDVIHILNSGDSYYEKDIIETCMKTLSQSPEVNWLHGDYIQFRGGIWLRSGQSFDPEKLYRGMRNTAHPTMFIKAKLYDKYGLFDLNKKIAMDYDFLVRIADEPFIYLDKILVRFAPAGVSETTFEQGIREVQESYRKYRGSSFLLRLWGLRLYILNYMMKNVLFKRVFQLKNKARRLD